MMSVFREFKYSPVLAGLYLLMDLVLLSLSNKPNELFKKAFLLICGVAFVLESYLLYQQNKDKKYLVLLILFLIGMGLFIYRSFFN